MTLTKEIVEMKRPGSDALLGFPLISSHSHCKKCGSKLYTRENRASTVIVYHDMLGTVSSTHYTRYCRRRECSYQQHYGYWTVGDSNSVQYDYDWASHQFFMSTRETAFSMEMLRRFEREILIGQISFKQKADLYNDIHDYYTSQDRIRLDRRRLETAFFKYAILKVVSWYAETAKIELEFCPDINNTLIEFTPIYQKLFITKYSAHRCRGNGCGKVLVLDGNQKNDRPVCAAADAGYVEFHGLEGKIKTGCMLTPEQKSTFCSLHKARQMENDSSGHVGNQRVIEMILNKRVTRSSVLYEVLWLGREMCETSWEQAENIPLSLIREFESGSKSIVTDSVTSTGLGQRVHTLTIETEKSHQSQTENSGRVVITNNEGVLQKEQTSLQCNTEKDKQRLHHRTAGILAGVWTCGIITILEELYLSESISQVYGTIHSYIETNPITTSELAFIVYDDGCHLRKFARNSVRKDLTDTTKKLAGMETVVDKLHFKGHKDEWCKRFCNPYTFPDLETVNTEVCEQTFSWLSRYSRITRHMNKQHFLFYILYLCDLHNRRKEQSTTLII